MTSHSTHRLPPAMAWRKEGELKAFRRKHFLHSWQVSKERCLPFKLNCQRVFIIVLCLLLYTIFASNCILYPPPLPSLPPSTLHKCKVANGFSSSIPPSFLPLSSSFLLQSLFNTSKQSNFVSGVRVHLHAGRLVLCIFFQLFSHTRERQERRPGVEPHCHYAPPPTHTRTHKQLSAMNCSLTKLAPIQFSSLTF